MSHRVLFTLTLFLTIANIFVWSFLGVQKAYANRVYPGVWVQAQPLAGLTQEQVVDKLKPINEAMMKQKITLHLADKEFQPTLADLGYTVNTEEMAKKSLELGHGYDFQRFILNLFNTNKSTSVPLLYDIDQGKFDSYLNEIGKDVIKEPKDITLTYKDGSIVITPAEEGVTLDKQELRQAIQKEVRPGESATIELSFGKTRPTIASDSQVAAAKEQLTKLLASPLKLQAEDINSEFTPAQIYSFVFFEVKDNALSVGIDPAKIQTSLGDIAKKVDVKAVATQVQENSTVVLREGTDGRQLDIKDATSQIKTRLEAVNLTTPVVLKVDKIAHSTETISPEYTLGRFPGRYLEIDLSAQRMHIIEGNTYVRTAIISTGNWSHPTPIGTFKILNHMEVAWSNKYKLYMPKWMAIQPDGGAYDGYGIHGLPYWPGGKKEGENHLGRPVSHGCTRLGEADINFLYEWAANGTPVVIHQ
jgi:lipoprotein-anchoring transpeptidase ErfK/SrfK